MSWKEGGLIKDKYLVMKGNGARTDPEAQYFVLRLDTDPHARIAARAYARSVGKSNPTFAQELTDWIWDLEQKEE